MEYQSNYLAPDIKIFPVTKTNCSKTGEIVFDHHILIRLAGETKIC